MNIDGFFNIDKICGQSSHDAVAQLKRALSRATGGKLKIGHCGTLDPAASGVLPIAVGKATRLSEYVMGRRKCYLAQISFGRVTDSYDGQGAVLSEADPGAVTAAAITALLPRFQGEIMQVPPAVSALKRGGEPMYKKVRRGETVQMEARPVRVYGLELLDFTPAQEGQLPCCRLRVDCGQGAYIRSIAHDMGQLLGCGAYLSALRRTQVASFNIEQALPAQAVVDRLEAALAQGQPQVEQALDELLHSPGFISMTQAVSHLPAFSLPAQLLRLAVHGNDCPLSDSDAEDAPLHTPLRALDPAGRLLGLAQLEQDARQGYLLHMDKVLVEAESYQYQQPPLVACAIGNFDGLHLGHRALMQELFRIKRERGGSGAVVTFSPHPLTLIHGQAPLLLSGERLKNELLLERLGVDEIITLIFDETLMNSTPEQFVDDVIVERLGVRQIVVGYNFSFAAGGQGTALLLRQLCAARGIEVTIVPEVQGPLGTVSSTNIRKHLQNGCLDQVNQLLGYWFCMEGEVVHGNHIGRTIGFPTANFTPEPGQAVMNNGVYAGRVVYRGRTYDGVINFGIKPTIAGQRLPLVEAHLFDVDIDLYDDVIRVYFGKFLRPERKFAGLDELKAQIEADGQQAREFLSTIPAKKHLPIRIG